MNLSLYQANGPQMQQQIQIPQGPQPTNAAPQTALPPAAHILVNLRAGQPVQMFNYRESIRKLGELIKTYTKEKCNDNISVQLRDWGYKVLKLDMRDAAKVKGIILEQLNLLMQTILVNEIDQTPLKEPVFLGELMGELSEFVGERAMLEDYLKLISVSIQSLKVHEFASAVIAWAKPIADWSRIDLNNPQLPTQALVIHQNSNQNQIQAPMLAPIANQQVMVPAANQNQNQGPNAIVNRGGAPTLALGQRNRPRVDPAWTLKVLSYAPGLKAEFLEQMIRGGLVHQKLKRDTIEHKNGADLAERISVQVDASIQENLDKLVKQFDDHSENVGRAINDIKDYHDGEIGVLNDRYDDLSKIQKDTYDRLVAEEKLAQQLRSQVASLNASLQSAWAQINNLANQDSGLCVIQ